MKKSVHFLSKRKFVNSLSVFACLLLQMFVVPAQAQVAEFLFNETDGIEVIDSKGGNNGQLVGEVSRTVGQMLGGLEMAGTGFVNAGKNLDGELTSLTLSAWIIPANSGDWQGIVMHGPSAESTEDDSYGLYLNQAEKAVGFKTSGTSAAWHYQKDLTKLYDGQWHLLTAVWDGSEKYIYVDNEVVFSAECTGTIAEATGRNLIIGSTRDKEAGEGLFQGKMDGVRVYDKALTVSEIEDVMKEYDGYAGIVKAEVTPVLDGVVDAVWANATVYNIDKPFQKETPTLGASGTTTWQGLWNDEGIYILLKVNDEEFYPAYMNGNDPANWNYDKPELYFDVNAEKKDGLGGGAGRGHMQVAPGFVEAEIDGTIHEDGEGIMHAFKVANPTYVAEYFIPFSRLVDKDGVEVNKSIPMGFDVTIIDGESAAPGVRQRAVWSNVGAIAESQTNMDDCGLVILVGAVLASDVEDITVSGGTAITTDNGKLQMVAKVEPSGANQNVKWVVENGTGRAAIDSKGVLTGVVDGTVLVKAIAKDGTEVEGKTTVTISGQKVEVREISYVTNGYFDKGADRAPWSSGAVVDGVLVLSGYTPGPNYWDFTSTQKVAVSQEDKNEPFTFSFVAWSDSPSTDASNEFDVDFEDSNNSYARYGVSTHPYATGGTSDWNFFITGEPTKYTFDVVFSNMAENCNQSLQFMVGRNPGPIYLDSISLVKNSDLALVGVKTLSNVNKVKLYPNPVQTELTISKMAVPNSKVSVYNSVGQKLMEKTANGTQAKFDVANLRKGMYFVRFSDGTSEKFMKQ